MHLNTHRRFVGQALGDAFGLIVLGLDDFIADKLQAGRIVEILDGENGTENAFKPDVGLAVGGGDAFLQKLLIGIDLQGQQMGDGERYFDLAELFYELAHEYLKRWRLRFGWRATGNFSRIARRQVRGCDAKHPSCRITGP